VSGGKAKVDPYYEKAPKKRRRNVPYDAKRVDEKGKKKPQGLRAQNSSKKRDVLPVTRLTAR